LRTFVIRFVLPSIFCLMPIAVALLVAAAIPEAAQKDYLERVAVSRLDWLILGMGSILFVSQMLLAWRALRWQGYSFDERADTWLNHLAQAAEWFPLLGLIGTVAAILQTFGSVAPGVTPQQIISKYGPAITATGSGLFMAFINILPTWMVAFGRDLIRSLAGYDPATGNRPATSKPGSQG